ncbi:MAG: hypothetical protein ACO3UU_03035 [Minisyncoccia bacterium]
MESIKQEFIQNCVQEDIDLYYSLHPEHTDDLIDKCAIMTDDLTEKYINLDIK